ncbi:unnamed protein product [Lymnaea stagnalis]|uniref:BPTI/Kunitz inhibitor domain-containing protein n=1 Tax=Lymnaea stagnalis TaxID=6523 RepID=A0AAV2HDC8_LYMST
MDTRVKLVCFLIPVGLQISKLYASAYPSVCSLPRNIGKCSDHSWKYYYAPQIGKCFRFAYKGCGPTIANRFDTLRECLLACKFSVKLKNLVPLCYQSEPLSAVGGDIVIKYFYSHEHKTCFWFLFPGSGEKAGNCFDSFEDCMAFCHLKDE